MIVVDHETLEAVMPRAGIAKRAGQARIVAAIAGPLQETLARYQINTPLRIAHFLAQIAHESDGFCTCEEYASGSAYEGRADLGNTEPGDGVRFKGRGLIQLTGRANYRTYGQRIGIDLVARPEQAEEPVTALILACEYWTATRGGLNRFADADDIVSITRGINGGTNGLEDRRRYLARAKQAIARTIAHGIAFSQPDDAHPVLRRGIASPAVEALQRALAASGLPVAIDGDFGPGTESAVKTFQRARDLVVDGVVGPDTWAALGGPAEPPTEATLVTT
jgi:putative chitinase